jgi:hypothetical protein
MKHLKKYNESSEFPKWVICIDPGCNNFIKFGKIYECLGERVKFDEKCYLIINDANVVVEYVIKRFIDAPQGEIKENINESDNTFPKWVICIDDSPTMYHISHHKAKKHPNLTIGKIYKCTDQWCGDNGEWWCDIHGDDGAFVNGLRKNRFIDLPQGEINENLQYDVPPPKGSHVWQESSETYPKWVICVDDQDMGEKKNGITQGKIYKCLEKRYSNMYLIINDNGLNVSLYIKRFIDVPQGKIQK